VKEDNKGSVPIKSLYNVHSKNELNCMYTNIRSLMSHNKRDEISSLLVEKKIDVLGITESWTHADIEDSEIKFEGYSLFRRDRNNVLKERGGGVLLYINEKLKAVKELDDVCYRCETVWAKIRDKFKNEIYFGVCYRSLTA